MSVFRNCGIVVAKSKFERLSGVGVWLANPVTPPGKPAESLLSSYPRLKARSTKQAIIMAIIIGTGGTATVALGAVAPQAAAITGAVISEGASAAALAAEAGVTRILRQGTRSHTFSSHRLY
ncbi:hypothetical protein ACEPPN_000725 [Leptodophora sp. 'Broadleaf-Isolate-01']